METQVVLDAIYTPSEDVVFRDIEGELIIVPLTRGVGGAEDEQDAIFTLNEWGRAVWERLDGQRSLRAVAADLAAEYEAPSGEIEADVLGLVGELVKRKMLVEAGPAPATTCARAACMTPTTTTCRVSVPCALRTRRCSRPASRARMSTCACGVRPTPTWRRATWRGKYPTSAPWPMRGRRR